MEKIFIKKKKSVEKIYRKKTNFVSKKNLYNTLEKTIITINCNL